MIYSEFETSTANLDHGLQRLLLQVWMAGRGARYRGEAREGAALVHYAVQRDKEDKLEKEYQRCTQRLLEETRRLKREAAEKAKANKVQANI